MKTKWFFPAVGLASCTILVGCSDPDPPKPHPPDPPAWQVVFDESTLGRAVLSIWGTGPDDVFAVGGPLGNGQETLAIHYDGSSWTELHPGGTETYWWVGGSGPNDVWMVGENGRVTQWDGKAFIEHNSGTAATLWGVWAAAPNDVWIVGGTPEGGGGVPNDIVFHWNGASLSNVALPQVLGRSFYKVWGRNSDDLYIVAEAATIWHKKGPDWILESDPPVASATLFTVAGSSAADVYAVGNFDILHSTGKTWEKLTLELTGSVNGVATSGADDAAIVGYGGLKQRFVAGQWIDDFLEEPHGDLHATWAEGNGAYWAVGGNFLSPASAGASRAGIVARYGAGKVATDLKQ